MHAKDLAEETYWALSGNKVRSILTMLGIIIGIASVIAMLAIGNGAQSSIQSSIQSVGSNLIIVIPGAARGVGITASAGRGSAQSLVQADADAIAKGVPSVKAVAPEDTRRYQITAPGTNTNTAVIGTVSAYQEVRNVQIDEGTFISDTDVRSEGRVAVLGPSARDDLFGVGASAIGASIRINGTPFRVIGVAKSKGGSGFNNPDDAIYVPLSSEQHLLSGDSFFTTISIEASDPAAMASVQLGVTNLLLSRHHIDNPANADFNVINQADIVATASAVTGTFTSLLASIAGISLLVGGIGIMNMMLTTVTERTREIGLRKAIGAERRDITAQFLLESVALTVVGGIAGIGLGWTIAYAISSFAHIAAIVTFSSVTLAFGVSAAIGIIFGYYPARRAAGLNPIEALRYE